MTPPSPAPTHSSPWPRRLRGAGWLAAWLVLAVYFHTPVREAMAPTLDGSNYGSYTWFTAHGLQYGTEVVPMAGPYGFVLYGWTYTGELAGLRTGIELLLNGTLAALVLWFFGQARGHPLRWVWLAAQVACSIFIEDLPLEWVLLLGGIYFLQAPAAERAGWRGTGLAAVLALVSLIKGTQLILGLATLGVVLGGLAWRRDGRGALRVAVTYAAALLGWWLLAGQNPLHLPAYVRGILELGGGYTEAMAIPTPPDVFQRAGLTSAALAAGLAWALWLRRREAGTIAVLLLLAGHAFVQWKHGVVRADGHAYIFFHFAVAAAVTLALAGWPAPGRDRGAALAGGAILLATLAAASLPRTSPMLPDWLGAPGAAWRRLHANAAYLGTLPARLRTLDQELAAVREAHALPAVRAAVGNRSIDAFGFEQGLLPLNDLNYRPRPMGGGAFNAYTPYLMALNRDFVRDPARRPDFYLVKPQTIDDRLGPQDDGLALVEILQRYRPVLVEHEHLLMVADPGAAPAAPHPAGTWRGALGQAVPVPAVGPGELLLARIDLHPSLLGRLRAWLYKPPEVWVELTGDDGAPRRRRLIPGMARSPFLLAPQFEELRDVADLYAPGAGRGPREFRVSTSDPACFAAGLRVEFTAAPRPAPLAPAALAELRGRIRFPFANREPESITPAFRPSPSVRFLHPPAGAAWILAGDERSFTFHYGIDREAYERGTTNGVDFLVEIRGPGGGVQPLLRASLQPLRRPADRGDHVAAVTLPLFAPGSRLVLRTDPGEFGDNAWDWAWVNRIELKGGQYAATQFPGFSRVPDAADAEHGGPVDAEGRPGIMLHLPGRISFNLAGTERRLAFAFGFLPGAYTDGGNTAGGDIIVEATRPGEPARELFRRRLHPVSSPGDRGPQETTVNLGGLAAGDVLSVRTAPLPGAGTSWGWTYLRDLHLE